MKTSLVHHPRRSRRQSTTLGLSSSRWLAYATAGAATAIAGVSSAEADITYSGVINQSFNAPPSGSVLQTFQLAQLGNYFALEHIRRSPDPAVGSALFGVYGAVAAGFAGFTANFNNTPYGYASKLTFGQNISTRNFVPAGPAGLPAYLAVGSGFGNSNSQWRAAGTGFIGFEFDNGGGTEYGWARITMDGAPGDSFTLVDYAFGGVGDAITAGQVPEPGSLGLLALGGAGLLAWRQRRALTPKPKSLGTGIG